MTVSWPGFEQVFTLTPGPAGNTPATLAALSGPVPHHLDPAFGRVYADTVEMLRVAFRVQPTPVILPGEAVAGLEAAAACLIRPDDAVLNLVSGIYGAAFGTLARRFTADVTDLRVSYDQAIPPAAVRAALEKRPDTAIVSLVHCDTPSGTVNDADAIARVVDEQRAANGRAGRAGPLLIVDAVSSFGGMRCDLAGWQADLVVTAPQKCLGGLPGLSLLHVSEAAWQRMEGSAAAPPGSVLSIPDWRDAGTAARPFPYTPPIAEILALHACLEQYLAEGPAAVQARHALAAEAVRAGAEGLGLRLWPATRSVCADTVTAVVMPAEVDVADVRARARSQSGVMLTGGQRELGGQVLQIGHMGPGAYPLSPVIALTALGRALRSVGAKADIGGAVEAAVTAMSRESGKQAGHE